MKSELDKKPIKVDKSKIDQNLALLFSSGLEKTKDTSRKSNEITTDEANRFQVIKQRTESCLNKGDKPKSAIHNTTNPQGNFIKVLTSTENLSSKRELPKREESETIIGHIERKRKRKPNGDNLEVEYMQKLAKQEEKELKKKEAETNLKIKKSKILQEDSDDSEQSGTSDRQSSTNEKTVPRHESMNLPKQNDELEKASRTVFLGNVSTLAISSKKARKTLLAHLASFLADLPAPLEGTPSHKVESLRFRSTAYTGSGLPKRAAYAKKEIMEATTKGTNAYVVYSNSFAARAAVKKLNGSIVLDRHLRVDGVAHPSKIDHRRCVFVGNLGFVDDESSLGETDEMSRKRSKIPADIEEGLWRQFSKVGNVESVRVVRDEKTRIGKGFAYVQFTDPNTVEAALLLNEKKYPPMLPRVLRVMRAKPIKKTAPVKSNSSTNIKVSSKTENSVIFNPKKSLEQLSLQGRASKLLGRVGAAKLKSSQSYAPIINHSTGSVNKNLITSPKNPSEGLIFEGYRAKSKLAELRKVKPRGKSLINKPKTRSSRRAMEWKKKRNQNVAKDQN